MNYTNRKKDRKAKKIMFHIYELCQFKSIHTSFSWKITLIGSTITILSLFFPWIINGGQNNTSWNAFNSLAGNMWFFALFLWIFLIFHVLSSVKKERIRRAFDIRIKNHVITWFIGAFILISSIVYISFVNGLSLFLDKIIIWNGVILYMVWGICIIAGWIIERKESRKRGNETFINEENQNSEYIQKKNNMKLPF